MFRRGKLPFVSNKDDRIKVFNERINFTEKHVLEVATIFADCSRKIAKHRDAYDELAKGLKNYADDEEINESLNAGLKNFTNAVTILGDYMDLKVHRIELKVVNELAQFENLCKSTRETLRLAVVARDKEVLKQRQMLEIKTKFAANNSAADSELLKSKLEVNRTNKEIDEILTNFEKRKLSDFKSTLKNFILLSIKYHTKSLEVLSASYFDVDNMDENSDLLEFQKIMKTKETQLKKTALKKGMRSQSMESLDRDQLLSPIKRTNRLSRSTKNLAEKSDDDLDDEEEEDEAEDEEDASEENSNEEESGSNSEDEAEDASESLSEAKTNAKLTTKKTNRQLFKAQQQSTSANLREEEHMPFAAKSLITKPSNVGSRLVTVVESKKK